MAISNELSSEIAMALFANQQRSPEELNNLTTILLEVHSTLQSLNERSRQRTEKAVSAEAASGQEKTWLPQNTDC